MAEFEECLPLPTADMRFEAPGTGERETVKLTGPMCRWAPPHCVLQPDIWHQRRHGEGVTEGMADLAGGSTVDILKHFHERLDVHFCALHEERQQLDPPGPVFALEHGLSPAGFDLLKATVRAAVAAGFGAVCRTWWLPFVVSSGVRRTVGPSSDRNWPPAGSQLHDRD